MKFSHAPDGAFKTKKPKEDAMFNIIDMDLRIPYQSFATEADNFADEWENDYNVEVDVSISPQITSKQNKSIYVITFTNKQLSGYEFTTYAEQGPNNTVALVPLLIGGAAYKTLLQDPANESTENDMAHFAKEFFVDLFTKSKGTLVYKTETGPCIIKKGNKSGTAIEAVLDGSGKGYCPHTADLVADGNLSDPTDNQDDSNKIKVVKKASDLLITNWAKDDSETIVFLKDATLSFNQKMDEIGKVLVNRRLTGQMDFVTFHTLFEQARTFGFTENVPELKMVEKLILEDN